MLIANLPSPEALENFLREHKFVVIQFWADWDGGRESARELLEKIPVSLSERFAFADFDCDPTDHHQVTRQCGVLNLPAFALFRDHTLVCTVMGLHPVKEINAYCERVLHGLTV